jgi:hypothetical protein
MRLIAPLLLSASAAVSHLSAEKILPVIVEPPALGGPLLNPGKGWSVFGLPAQQPPEVLALTGMGVRRFAWADLEPKEGEYNWKPVDEMLERWAALGRVCNIGVMCASTHGNQPGGYVTPEWVFAAGAQKHEIDLTPAESAQGTPGHKVAPVFDDPVFLTKLGNFLKAFAARYDGDRRIALIDIRSYGNWGEAHMHPFKVPDISPEKFRQHIQLHLDAFKKTRLCLSCNSHLGRPSAFDPVYDWAVKEMRVAPRRDGICGNSDGSETARGLGLAPAVFELYENYPVTKERGWWDGRKDAQGRGFTLAECVEKGRPTWVDLARGGKSGQQLIAENRELVDRLTNRIGYHFVLQRASFPSKSEAEFDLELEWRNEGVAPVYLPAFLSVAIFDRRNNLIAAGWPEGSKPREWLPGRVIREKVHVVYRNVQQDTYRVAIGLTPTQDMPDPYIRLGSQLPMLGNWHVLGTMTVEYPIISKK